MQLKTMFHSLTATVASGLLCALPQEASRQAPGCPQLSGDARLSFTALQWACHPLTPGAVWPWVFTIVLSGSHRAPEVTARPEGCPDL